MNNPSTIPAISFYRRITALVVAAILLSQATFAAPEAARTVVIAAAEGYTDATFAWQNHYAGTFAKLLPSTLSSFVTGTRTPPNVVRISIYPKGLERIREGQPLDLAAVAYSVHGDPVPGVKFQWTIEDQGRGKTRRLPGPRFTPRFSGHYTIVVHAGTLEARVPVIVDDDPGFVVKRRIDRMVAKGDNSLLNSMKAAHQYSTSSLSSKKNYGAPQDQQTVPDDGTAPATHGPSAVENKSTLENKSKNRRMLMMRPANDDGWDNSNWWLADDPNNNPGNPPGESPSAGAANGNFQFSAPVVSIPARGIDIALSLNYNARVWSKAGNTMSFDAERGYPAPGWNLGFGKIMFMGTSGGCMLIDADGTNRSYTGTITNYSGTGWSYSYFTGHTTDGSFIDYDCGSSTSGGTTYISADSKLPNGTKITYGSTSASGQQAFPGTISDAQGNYIQVNYRSSHGPAIDTISDTLGRVYTFNYDSSNRLISVSVPQFNSTTPRTAIRLHYKSVTLSPGWAYPVTGDTNNSSPDVIDAIYYPGTSTGYWFGADSTASDYGTYYSDYGMLMKIMEQRGMSCTGCSSTSQGSISAGTMSKQVLYDFPQHADFSLTDAPTYSNVTESWDGMDTSAAVTHYVPVMNTSPRTITITQPNGLVSRQYMYNAPGAWNDGLIFEDDTLDGSSTVLGKSVVSWAQGDYGAPRPSETDIYDERSQMLKTTYTYGTAYNQLTSQKSYDYDGATLLKEIRNTYENDSHYIYNHIFSLVKTNEVYDGSGNRVAKTDYEYDNNIVVNGLGSTDLANTPGVTMHYDYYDPYTTDTTDGTTCATSHWETEWCTDGQYYEYPYECDVEVCDTWEQVSIYSVGTPYRGNLTETTAYSDAATPSGGIPQTKRYDETGNVVAESASCCELKGYTYTSATDYAYPTTMTRGSSDTSSTIRNTSTAVYDYNTGLITSSTDPNSRTTTTAYDANTLRPTQTTSPTGAYSLTTYDESGMTITDEVHDPSAAVAGKTITYLNGIGQTKRTDTITGSTTDISETKYDQLARVWKESRPYRSGDTIYWTEKTYDLLGRVSQITAPDGSTTKAFYNETSRPDSASSDAGSTIRVQDAWGRERWGRYDAIDRLVEVVEPNPGDNGSVLVSGSHGSGSLATNYTFDTLGNLTQSNQGGQLRSFKYDSLSRLIRQKLAEQTSTLNDTGGYVGAGGTGANWSTAFTYDDRSNVTQKEDARGVITTFSYLNGSVDDPLNRLQSISYGYDSGGHDASKPIASAETVTFEYMTTGDQDRIKKITTAGIQSEDYAYDVEGRVTDHTQTIAGRDSYPWVTSYTYDSLDRVTQTRYPAQYGITGSPRRLIENTFDSSSRLSTLKINSQQVAGNISYNAASQTTSIKIGPSGTNQVTENYSFDGQTGLLSGQTATMGTTTLLDLSYDYNRNNSSGSLSGKTGHLTKITDNLNSAKNREYQFDAIGRLAVAKGKATSQWTQTYSYDRYGNRTSVTSSGTAADGSAIPSDGIPSLSYDTTNKTNRITTAGFEYDVAGNQTRALAENGTTWLRYEYDAANRLRYIRRDDTSQTLLEWFQYGPGNVRAISYDVLGGTNTSYATVGGTVLSEYTEYTANVPTWEKSYTYFGDSQLSTSAADGAGGESTTYDHPDTLGARLISDQSSGTVTAQAHLPFGRPLNAESSVTNNNRRFTSYDRSPNTGLDYAQNRTYDSKQGRFTQVDPIGMGDVTFTIPQSVNLYSYCQNDPVNNVDPNGLGFFSKLFHFIAKALKWIAVAALIAFAVLASIYVPGSSGILHAFTDKLIILLMHFGNIIGSATGGLLGATETISAMTIGLIGVGAVGVGAAITEHFTQAGPKTKQFCKQIEPYINAARTFFDNAWKKSKPGTPNVAEQGGLAEIQGDGSLYDDQFYRAQQHPGSLDGFPQWAWSRMHTSIRGGWKNSPPPKVALWYHTHPFEKGDIIEKFPDGSYSVALDPNFPSKNDRGLSRGLNTIGVAITSSSIVVFNGAGRRCRFDR